MTRIRETDTEDEPREYASPACFMHEVDSGYSGIMSAGSRDAVIRWRERERERLIARRLAIPAQVRADSAYASSPISIGCSPTLPAASSLSFGLFGESLI